MAVRDNIIYELFPQAGDVSPHNEIGGGNVLAGGTIALIDRGAGDYAWQFSGANSLADGVSKVYTPSAAAGGFTMLVTLKVVAAAASFSRYASMQVSTSTSEYMGFGENGANAVRSRFSASSSGGASFSGIGSTETTFVVRVKTNGAGAEVVDTWKGTTGRVGTDPDATQTTAATLSRTFNQITAGGGSGTVQIKRMVIWDAEKTNADCTSGADDPTTALLTPGVTITGAVGNATAAGQTATMPQLVNIAGVAGGAAGGGATASILSGGSINAAVGGAIAAGSTASITQPVTIVGTIGAAAAAGAVASVIRGATIFGIAGSVTADGATATVTNTAGGSFVTEPLINNTGAGNVLASQAVAWTWFPGGRVGALDLITAIDGAGTTDALGQLTVTGLVAGDGMLWVAVLNTDATDDYVFYEAGTVT